MPNRPAFDLPPLDVICEDGPVLAINKPAGLLTQGVPRKIPTLESQVRGYIKEKYAKPGNVYLGVPHRLDRSTSGVIVFARNSKAASRLADQFEERLVRKEYLAVVEPGPLDDEGTLSDWLIKQSDAAHVVVAPPHTGGAKEAKLRYRVLERCDGRALLHVEAMTGRMHQIRVQLASRGWPVVGDVQYGSTSSLIGAALFEAGHVIALHARRLHLRHPVRYDDLFLEATMPAAWSSLGFDFRGA